MSRAGRLLRLVEALRGRARPVRAADLAAELGVSVRTIYRDAATLAAEGLPIASIPGEGYLLGTQGLLAAPELTADEAAAVVAGLAWAERNGGADMAPAAVTARRKLRDAATAIDRALREQSLLIGPPGAAPPWPELRAAIRDERRVDLDYRDDAGQRTRRRVWPLVVGIFDDCAMLGAWCELRRDFRHFRLDRIEALSITDERLPRPHRVLLAEWRQAEGIAGD